MIKKANIAPIIETFTNRCEGCKYEDEEMCSLVETKKGFNPIFGWGGTACFGTGYHHVKELLPRSVMV